MKKSAKHLLPLTGPAFAELERRAELAKCLDNPKRLGIVEALTHHERTVGDLAHFLGIASQVVSIELRIMKEVGAVAARRQHPEVYYRLTDPLLGEAAKIMRRAAQSSRRVRVMAPLAAKRRTLRSAKH